METKLLEERLDYIKIMGDSSHISHGQELTYFKLKKYFFNTWKMELYQRGHTLKFRTHLCDRTIVVTFTKAKGAIKGNRIEVEFPGSFLYGDLDEREYQIRAFISQVWEDLGIPQEPYVAVFDICIDRLGATFGSHGVRLNDNRYKITHRRSSKFKYNAQPFHMNSEDRQEQTGQMVYANKFDAKWYCRTFALKDRYNSYQYKNYADWYWRLYAEYERVLRFEIKFKKELCALFSILFFSHRMPIKKILPKCMTLFASNHKFVHAKSGRPIKRMEELFKEEKLLTLKEYQAMVPSFGDDDLKYKAPKYDENRLINQISRHMLATGGISDTEIFKTVFKTRRALRKEIRSYICELEGRLIRELKLAPAKSHGEITERYQTELAELNRLLEVIPENVERMKQELLEIINGLDESDLYRS
jgi:hypothetical protein